jgi:hypothetical protein
MLINPLRFQPHVQKSMSDSESGSSAEWCVARDALVSTDSNLHDLRKWGFSFITGLLTVDALFANIQDNRKLAALAGTYVLVTGLVVVDRNYHVLQDALAQRAGIIERRTGMETKKRPQSTAPNTTISKRPSRAA